MKLVYFAWVREKIGIPEEDITLPDQVKTVGELIRFLKNRGPNYAHALEQEELIRVALDHEHVDHQTPLANAKMIALFPPMTGG